MENIFGVPFMSVLVSFAVLNTIIHIKNIKYNNDKSTQYMLHTYVYTRIWKIRGKNSIDTIIKSSTIVVTTFITPKKY